MWDIEQTDKIPVVVQKKKNAGTCRSRARASDVASSFHNFVHVPVHSPQVMPCRLSNFFESQHNCEPKVFTCVCVTVAWVVARSKTGVSVLMSTNEIFVQDLRWLPIHDGLHLHNSVYV